MKKALVVTALAGFAYGFLENDMKTLQNMGYEVHCAANKEYEKNIDAEVHFPSIGVAYHQIKFDSKSPLSKKSFGAAREFCKLIRENKFDVIHCHTPIVGAIVRMCCIFERIKGTKVIYTTHGLAFTKNSGIKSWLVYAGMEWICSWFTDAVITINYEDYDKMKRMGCKRVFHINGVGVNTEKYHNVNIDRNEYRSLLGIEKNDIMILSVGELSVRKNHQIIIKALAQINDPRYVFVVCGHEIGGSDMTKMLTELAEEKNVRLKIMGFRHDIPEICHCADIAVLPSLREGLGLAGIEALASGVPVVGTAVQGIKDYVVDGETGYLCDAYDESQFAEKIKILSNPIVKGNMIEACVKKAEEFSTKVSFEQMESIYELILERVKK